jgi:hypothetical protein
MKKREIKQTYFLFLCVRVRGVNIYDDDILPPSQNKTINLFIVRMSNVNVQF